MFKKFFEKPVSISLGIVILLFGFVAAFSHLRYGTSVKVKNDGLELAPVSNIPQLSEEVEPEGRDEIKDSDLLMSSSFIYHAFDFDACFGWIEGFLSKKNYEIGSTDDYRASFYGTVDGQPFLIRCIHQSSSLAIFTVSSHRGDKDALKINTRLFNEIKKYLADVSKG